MKEVQISSRPSSRIPPHTILKTGLLSRPWSVEIRKPQNPTLKILEQSKKLQRLHRAINQQEDPTQIRYRLDQLKILSSSEPVKITKNQQILKPKPINFRTKVQSRRTPTGQMIRTLSNDPSLTKIQFEQQEWPDEFVFKPEFFQKAKPYVPPMLPKFMKLKSPEFKRTAIMHAQDIYGKQQRPNPQVITTQFLTPKLPEVHMASFQGKKTVKSRESRSPVQQRKKVQTRPWDFMQNEGVFRLNFNLSH